MNILGKPCTVYLRHDALKDWYDYLDFFDIYIFVSCLVVSNSLSLSIFVYLCMFVPVYCVPFSGTTAVPCQGFDGRSLFYVLCQFN